MEYTLSLTSPFVFHLSCCMFCRLSTVFLVEFEIKETIARKFSRFWFKFFKAKIHSPLVSQFELSR